MYANFGCNFIRSLKTDSFNIICKLIRIFFQHFIHFHSVILINLSCQLCGNTVLLQINHGFSHIFLFFKLRCNLLCFSLTDSFDLRKSFRLFFNNAESILFKLFHDSASQCRTHTFHCSGSKISFNRNNIFWFFHFIMRNLQLLAINIMIHIFSLNFKKFSFINIVQTSHACHFTIFMFNMEYCIPIIRISIYNMTHIPCNCFHTFSSLFLYLFLFICRKRVCSYYTHPL